MGTGPNWLALSVMYVVPYIILGAWGFSIYLRYKANLKGEDFWTAANRIRNKDKK